MNDRGQWTSASSAEADELCPGRHLAQQSIPEPERTFDSVFGTRVHAAWAKNDSAGLTVDEAAVFESVRAIEKEVVEKYFGDFPSTRCFREKRLWMDWGGAFNHSGQPDVVYRSGTRALILEGKMLWGEHEESPRNKQLRDQVCLVWRTAPLLDEVACAVIQPRISRTPEICVYNKDEIELATAWMYERVKKSNDPASPRVAGEVQCKFCRAVNTCPEWAKWATSIMPMPPALSEPVTVWTPQQRQMFCERRAMAQQWLDDTTTALKEMLIADPEAIPGFTLRKGAVIETINDPQALFERFHNIGGSLEQFMKAVKIAKTQLKEQVREVTKKVGGLLDKEVERLTEGIVDSRQNAPSIVKDKESR